MTVEEVYICDKLEGLEDVKPATKSCRRAVDPTSDGGGVSVVLRVIYLDEDNEAHDDMQEVKFCSPTHANFWLSRQRVS